MGVFLKTGPWHQSLSFLRKLPMYNILNFSFLEYKDCI